MNPSINKDKFCQIGLIVRDRDATAAKFEKLFGVKAFGFMETQSQEESGALLRGEPATGRAKMAFIDFGAIQVEIMEPFGGPSAWQEFLDDHGEGIHHLAFRSADMDADGNHLEQSGYPLVQKGDFGEGCYAYYDTDASPGIGFAIELLHFYNKTN